MSRRRLLDEEAAEQLYQEYCLWLSLNPKKLMQKYGISRSTMTYYVRHKHKRKAA